MPRPCVTRSAAAIRTLTGFATVAVAAPLADADAVARGRRGRRARRLPLRRLQVRGAEGRARRASCVHGTAAAEPDAARRGHRDCGSAVALVKDLVSIPAEWLGPADFAERADASRRGPARDGRGARRGRAARRRATAASSASARVRTGRRASCGSSTRPTDATRHVALVGKGITFDTGGLSLKPAASMVGHEVRHVRRGDRSRGAARRRHRRRAA